MTPLPGASPHTARQAYKDPPPVDPSIKAVPGLPENIYREDYLKALSKEDLEALAPTKAIDLEFSPFINR
jgi:hypothetical protein